MVDQLDVPRTDWRAVTALFLVLCLVAMLASLVTPVLIPTLGLVVVGAGLFLPPRPTAVVGTAAVLLGAILMVGSEASYGPIRLANVLLASVLAVLASLMLARRLQRIEQQSRTEAAVLASVPDALFVLDSEGRVGLANAGLTRLVPGAHVGEALHPLLGHVLADGTPCPGGCALDGGTLSQPTVAAVEGERITRAGRADPGRIHDAAPGAARCGGLDAGCQRQGGPAVRAACTARGSHAARGAVETPACHGRSQGLRARPRCPGSSSTSGTGARATRAPAAARST